MICQACGKENKEGKFCSSCGARIKPDEVAAAAEQPIEENEMEPEKTETETTDREQLITEEQGAQESSEFVDYLKEESSKFGAFLITHIKSPREAKNTMGNYLASGILMVVIFSLIITLNNYISLSSGYFYDPTFTNDFLVPFAKHLVMFGILVIVIFGAVKAVNQELTIQDVFAKYGAYLVPFTLLYIVSIILSLIKITVLALYLSVFSIIGVVMLIPIFILSERDVKGFDLIYTIIVVTLVSFAVFGYLSISTFTGSLLGGFDFDF